MDSQPQEEAEEDAGSFEYIYHIITSGLQQFFSLLINHYSMNVKLLKEITVSSIVHFVQLADQNPKTLQLLS